MDRRDSVTLGPYHIKESSYQKRVGSIDGANKTLRPNGFRESMEILYGEININISSEMDYIIRTMHSQINRVISTAISDMFIPDIESIFGTLPLNQNGVGTDTSSCDQCLGTKPKGSEVFLTRNNSRSDFAFREDVDLTLSHASNNR